MSTKQQFAGVLFIGIMTLTMVLFIPARTIEIKPEARTQSTTVEIIAEIAGANGIEPIHLFGIAAQESSFGKFQVGDSGCSRGFFHINICVNQGAKEIIGDLIKETQWVAKRLNDLGYQTDSRKAIAAYNRPADPNYKYADLVEKRIGEIDKFIRVTDR
jgi:hypothetical protein